MKQFYTSIDLKLNEVVNATDKKVTSAERLGLSLNQAHAGTRCFDTDVKKFFGWNGEKWVDLSQIIDSPLVIAGNISNADTNPPFPSNPKVGDVWHIIGQSGKVGDLDVRVDDQIIYYPTGWELNQGTASEASKSSYGYIRVATLDEVKEGTSSNLAISPDSLKSVLNTRVSKIGISITKLFKDSWTKVVHGLNCSNKFDVTVTVYNSLGEVIYLDVRVVDSNAVEVKANEELTDIRVFITG